MGWTKRTAPAPGALAWLLLAAGASVLAQQTVEITGSRLPTAQAEGASPVQVITRDDILRSGAGSMQEVLIELARAGGGSRDLSGNGSFAPGASGASLRYLGRQSTLVLLNFRRVAPYPLADYSEVFTNIDALPFEAIERIEVLASGASALYGSDAVAGVINIITRRDWVGLQGRVSQQQSLANGRFGSTTASLTGGWTLSNGGHLLANLEVYRREGVMWRGVMQRIDPALTSRSGSYGTYSSYSVPGNVIGAGPLPGCAPELLIGGLCRYDRYARFEAVPAAERANLLVGFQQPLAAGRRAFGELLLADTRSTYQSPYLPYGPALGSAAWGNPVTQGTQTFWYRGLPSTHPLNQTGQDDAELRYRFTDAPSQTTAHTQQYRGLVGLSGTWRGLEWETASGLMGGRTVMDEQGMFSASGFRAVIGNDDPAQVDPLFFQRGYRIGQANTPAVINLLFPHFGYTGELRQWFADLRLAGPLPTIALPGGPLGLALGAELRHERYRLAPTANLLAGDIVGNGLSDGESARWVASAYAEAELPLSPALTAGAAARLDKFGAGASRVSPKLALRWQAAPALLLRGTVEGGFRAPNLTENATSTKFSFDNTSDPQRCPQAEALATDLSRAAAALPAGNPQSTLLQARADQIRAAECTADVASVVRNNPALKPETSRSLSLGWVFTPTAQTRLSADAWVIERRNEIGLKSTADLLNSESVLPAGTVLRDSLVQDRSFSAAEQARYGVSAGALRSTTAHFENTSRTRVAGIDFSAQARSRSALGALLWQLDAVFLIDKHNWSDLRQGWGDNLSGRRGMPRWRANPSLTLEAGRWQHTLRATVTSASSSQGDFYDTTYSPEGCAAGGYSPADCRIAGHTRWDYALRWQASTGWVLAAQVQNLLDSRMPVDAAAWLRSGGIVPPATDNAKGRMLRLTLEWRGR